MLESDIEQVLPPGAVKRGGLFVEASALLEQIGDVLSGEGFKDECILDGAGEGLMSVDFT